MCMELEALGRHSGKQHHYHFGRIRYRTRKNKQTSFIISLFLAFQVDVVTDPGDRMTTAMGGREERETERRKKMSRAK